MRFQSLGATGMQVSRYCLGTMMFGKNGNPDHEDSINIIHAALDSGINFVDTADVYSRGESEEIVGKALKGRRDNVILATKAHVSMGDDPNMQGNSRRWIMKEIDASLRRLQTDWIDLYQMHRPDPNTDVGDTLSALSDLVHAGKVRAIGGSAFPAEFIVEAQWESERRGLERFRCEQASYSIFNRTKEPAVFPTVQRYGMGAIVYGPLDGGWLGGRVTAPDPNSTRAKRQAHRYDTSDPENVRKLGLLEQLNALAADIGHPLSHLALGFVTAHPAVSAAIIGPRTMEQLKDAIAGADVELDDVTLDRIDAIVAPGSAVGTADTGWALPWMADTSARRRPHGTRAAS